KVNEADEWDAILIQAITLDPITPVKRPNGYYSASDYVQSNNPVAHLHYGKSDGPRDILDFRTVGNVFAELTFFKGFSLKSNFGFDYKNENGTNFVPTFTVYNSTGPVIGQSVVHATLEQRNEVDQNWSWSNYLNYQKQFGKNDLTVMAGMESSEERTNWFDVKGSDYLSNDPDLANFNNSVNPIASATGTTTAKNMYSYFGRINYAHEDKYLATFNIRRDGSSYFGPDDQYGIFPAFSLGWVISKENFMKSFEFINTLKLRAGWGSVGNDKITPYGYYTQAASNRPYVLNNTITDGVSFPSLGNPNLHWETTTTTNVGLDLGLWQNKLTFSG